MILANHMTARQLRDAKHDCGLTQERLADLLGIDPRTLRRYLSGDLPVPASVALAVRHIQDKLAP